MAEAYCAVQGLLIEPNLQEFDKIPAKRPNAIAVHAAICSQEQLVHFVGKGAVIPLAGNSAGLPHHCLSQIIPSRPSHWPCDSTTDTEERPYPSNDVIARLASQHDRQHVMGACAGHLRHIPLHPHQFMNCVMKQTLSLLAVSLYCQSVPFSFPLPIKGGV